MGGFTRPVSFTFIGEIMLAQFGYGVLVVSFMVALYSVIVAFIGDKNKSPQMV
jgi:hypothetical protein